MTRIPPIDGREALEPSGQVVYDRIQAERYGQVLPHNLLMLRDPELARIVLELGTQVGIHSKLPFLDKEIMAVAAYPAAGCSYAAELHVRIAEERGLSAEPLVSRCWADGVRGPAFLPSDSTCCATRMALSSQRLPEISVPFRDDYGTRRPRSPLRRTSTCSMIVPE